jgi:hypothetical protein
MKYEQDGTKPHNDGFNNVYFFLYIVNVVKSRNGGECENHRGEEKDIRSLSSKSSGKQLPLGRSNVKII